MSLFEKALEAQEREQVALAEVKRLRKVLHELMGNGDEELGISAVALMGRVGAAEELVREVLEGRGGIPEGWAAKARAQLAAARVTERPQAPVMADAIRAFSQFAAIVDSVGNAVSPVVIPPRAIHPGSTRATFTI